MKVTSSVQIGDVSLTFEIEDVNVKAAMLEAIGLATPREVCNICGHVGLEEKRPQSRKTKGGEYTYIEVVCPCGAKSVLTDYKTGGHYWREYERYEGDPPQHDDDDGPAPARPPARRAGEPRQRPPAPKPAPPAPVAEQPGDGERITRQLVDGIVEDVRFLGWESGTVQALLQQRYGVTKTNQLTIGQGRDLRAYLKHLIENDGVDPDDVPWQSA